MKINVLKANNGDAIHIAFGNKNILIDTGVGTTFISKPNGRKKDGELKKLIDELESKNEKIDLLIISHWDDDHIGGVLKWFKENLESAKTMIKHIWFNSGLLINKYFESEKASGDNTTLNVDYNPNTSINQGITFEQYILENRISYSLIKTDTNDLDNIVDGTKFTILSPTDNELEKLLVKWKGEYNPDTSVSNKDYNKSLEELLQNEFKEDTSIHNGSSIAFILEIENKKMLFLGDAHPSVVVDSLVNLEYSVENKLKIDLMKVSHHGSKANTSDKLLDIIECDTFVISTDGSNHGLPNKETIARIINKHENSKIYFNYTELIDQIFTEDELTNNNFKTLDVKELSL